MIYINQIWVCDHKVNIFASKKNLELSTSIQIQLLAPPHICVKMAKNDKFTIFLRITARLDIASGLYKPNFGLRPQNEYISWQKKIEVVNFITASTFGSSSHPR